MRSDFSSKVQCTSHVHQPNMFIFDSLSPQAPRQLLLPGFLDGVPPFQSTGGVRRRVSTNLFKQQQNKRGEKNKKKQKKTKKTKKTKKNEKMPKIKRTRRQVQC